MPRRLIQFLSVALVIVPIISSAARGQTTRSAIESEDEPSLKDRLINTLPPAISDGLDINAWGWFGDSQSNEKQFSNYYEAEVALGITKSFDQRVAITAQGNFIDADGERRGELEKGYISALLLENQGTVLTVGKFNADFGVEARDFWNRTTGSTSVIFGAEPQDLVGAMITQPIGDTGVTLRPFIASDFQGDYYFNQSPSAGLTTEYKPSSDLDFVMTGWLGPGLVNAGGRPIHSPFLTGDNYDTQDDPSMISNWQGTELDAESGGTLYFLDGKAVWQARPDLSLSVEALIGSTSTSNGHWGWWGCAALANYDLTDRWHFFARYSFLNDADGIITGAAQRYNEFSGGVGYQIIKGVEIRGEYRHDSASEAGQIDAVSAHLTFTF